MLDKTVQTTMDAAYTQLNKDLQIKEARLLSSSPILVNTVTKTITVPSSSYVYNAKEGNFSSPTSLPIVIDYTAVSGMFCLYYSYNTHSFGVCSYSTTTTNIISDGVYFLGLFYNAYNPICNFFYTINGLSPIADSSISQSKFNFSISNIKYPVSWTNAGKYLNSSGGLDSSGDYVTSDYTLLLSKFITLKGYLFGTILTHLCIYDSKKIFIAAISGLTQGDVDTTLDLSSYVNAKYVRIYTGTAYSSSFIVSFNDGDTIKTLLDKIDNKIYSNQFAIPAYIDAVINRQTQFWIDGISADPNLEKTGSLLITSSNKALRKIENVLRYEPTATTANFSVTLKKTDVDLNELYSTSFTVRTIPKNVGNGVTVKNILICGDSLVDNNVLATTVYSLLTEDADFVVNQLGIYGPAGGKHEGRGGWGWNTYINPTYESTPYSTKTNAFMFNGVLDFQHYCTINSYSGIDYFVIALGTNDVTQGITLQTATSIATIIANVKIFINALLSSDKGFPNCKIAIGLPAVGAPVFQSTSNADVFRKSIQMLNQAYIVNFDNGVYNANVTTVMHGAYIDRENSYQYNDIQRSARTTSTTIREYTNDVHPATIGYQQWGDGLYGKIRAFMNNIL